MTSRSLNALVLATALVGLTAAPAWAQRFTLTAQLTGANETPAGINTGAFGSKPCRSAPEPLLAINDIIPRRIAQFCKPQ